MITLFALLGWIVLAGLLILIGVLATPVKVDLSISREVVWSSRVVTRPFGGLGPRIKLYDSQRLRSRSKSAEPKKKPDRRKRSRSGRRGWIQPDTVTRLSDLVTGLLKCVQFEGLSADIEFGLEDPADTGALYGQLTPLVYASVSRSIGPISLRPDFNEARLEGDLHTRFRIVPIAVLPPVARFAWHVFGPIR